MNSTTHDNDFYTWTQEQAHLLRTGQLPFSEMSNPYRDYWLMAIEPKKFITLKLVAMLGLTIP